GRGQAYGSDRDRSDTSNPTHPRSSCRCAAPPSADGDHTNLEWYGQRARDSGILCRSRPPAGSGGYRGQGVEAAVLDRVRSEADGTSQPKYRQLREALLESIRGLPEGAALPTERELCATFGVSRAT